MDKMDKYERRSKNKFNKLAISYDETKEGVHSAPLRTFLRKNINIKPGAHILDFACGNGAFLKSLCGPIPFYGYGIDISENMVKIAQYENPEMKFTVSAEDDIPAPDSYFDIITVCDAFHHFAKPEFFVLECARTLKPAGLFYIADVYLSPAKRKIKNTFSSFSSTGDYMVYSPLEIHDIALDVGFKPIFYDELGEMQLHCFIKP